MLKGMSTIIVVLASLLALALPAFAQTATTRTTAPASVTSAAPAVVISLRGTIDDYTRDNLVKRFAAARAAGARTVLLQINTPGGLVTSALDITRFLRAQDDLHVVAYIDEKAYSAGAMIALACNEMVMQSGSFVGDCAPIMFSETGGLQTLGETERAKAVSPILADFHTSADRNGYDRLLVSAMVSLKRSVHWVEGPAGDRRFVSGTDYRALLDKGWKPVPGVPDPVNPDDMLLTADARLAQTLGLSKGTYASVDALADARNLTIVDRLAPSAGEIFVGWLNSAAVRAVLIFVLIQSLYIAFTHPGHGWPEAIATTALGVLIAVPLLTGYASWLDIACILAGLTLLALEIFVVPGFGITGISGIALLVIGLVLTFVGPEPALPGVFPALPATRAMLLRGTLSVAGALVACMVVSILLARHMQSLPMFNRLILNTTSPTPTPQAATLDAPLPQPWPPVGSVGVAVTDLRPGGSASFPDPAAGGDRIADVVSESGYVSHGTRVVVRELRGAYAVVRAVPAPAVRPTEGTPA